VPIGRHAGAGGQSARVGLARELPPQRVVGRPPALLCGGGGPCRGHTAAPMALRRRCARRRAAECACRTAGSVGFELGWMLGAFRRRPRPSLLGILFSVDIARCVARRRFSGSRRRSRPRLPRIFLKRAIQQVLDRRCTDGACSCWRVARERRPDTTHTFLGCSPSPTSSFLTTFSGAERGSGRTPMVLSCRASPKYPGCVTEAQADGRGSAGVSRRLPLEAAA